MPNHGHQIHALTQGLNQEEPFESRIAALLGEQLVVDHKRTDRMFAWLMGIQWLAGIAAALLISPRAWEGSFSHTHVHVWAALFLGGLISGFPIFLALTRPGSVLSRHVIAVGQILSCGLLIHLCGGRIEAHFQYFGALAFLAFYRDWRVLVTASAVAAVDHFVRGLYWPQSMFGVPVVAWWRWLEHVGWMLFEDVFLILAIRQSLEEMTGVAERQAKLEFLNESVERKVDERTGELRKEIAERTRVEESLRLAGSAVEQSTEAIMITDANLTPPGPKILFVNPAFTTITGYSANEAIGQTPEILQGPRTDRTVMKRLRRNLEAGEVFEGESIHYRKDGKEFNMEWHIAPIRDASNRITHFVTIHSDTTERNRAQAELENVNKQLQEASRRGGMAEIATNVLHNVGNVLNSVNISANLLTENAKKSRLPGLAKVVDLLREHTPDIAAFMTQDTRGRHVPAYLAQLSQHLTEEQGVLVKELESLQHNVGHIKEIVALQQNYATFGGVKEVVNVLDLVEDSVRMNEGGLSRHSVELVREFQSVPPLNGEKHKIVQILVNLLSNAKHACQASHRVDKRVTLRVADGDGSVKISVMDNGIGIAPENLTRIFNHGFTTSKDGHGFGLHSSALAAKEMGGSVVAQSDGPERGATFTLELPCMTKENSNE